MRKTKCVATLTLIAIPTLAHADTAPKEEESPVAAYREQSIGMTSGMDVFLPLVAPWGWTGFGTQLGNTSASGVVGFNADFRGAISGIVISGQLGFSFADGLITNAIFVPGFSVGYAIPLSSRVAVTPAFHAVFLIPSGQNTSAVVQMTGEVALQYFFGKHGYIEPVIALGDLQNPQAGTSGQATLIFGAGYRLGVVF